MSFFSLFSSGPNVQRMTAPEADTAIKAGTAVLVDVREEDEWEEGVAAPAILLSFSDLMGPRKKWASFLTQNKNKQLILYCLSGARSDRAAKSLIKEGYNAINLGGISAWARSGFPLRKP